MAKNNRRNTAKRAAATRSARNAFTSYYGVRTVEVVTAIARGWTNDQILDLGYSPTTVAAYRANVTRGTYSPFVNFDGSGDCSY